MLEGLIDRFTLFKRKVLGYGRITTSELEVILKDIRVNLLEADVNYKVVKDFVDSIRTKCAGIELAKTLNPGEVIIRAVYDELVQLLGSVPQRIEFKSDSPLIVSLIGLQGAGKTTTAVKLALKYKGKRPLLVPADIKRPAAFEQLQVLGQRVHVPVCERKESVTATVKQARENARAQGHGLVLIDTAGRLHIDDELIQELVDIDHTVQPDYHILVADGMSGQDAVNQAIAFKERVGLEGAILTKMDGDTRGGAALSIARAAGVPIYYIGTSEDVHGLEEFFPDRMAQRIMGMGDIESLVDKIKNVETEIDEQRLRSKVVAGELNFEDFLQQMKAMKRLGPLAKIASMIPGVRENDVDEHELVRVEAIICSMTHQERRHPEIIDGSRKRRIAAGSGTTVQDVNRLLKQFSYARDMLQKMGKGKLPFRFR